MQLNTSFCCCFKKKIEVHCSVFSIWVYLCLKEWLWTFLISLSVSESGKDSLEHATNRAQTVHCQIDKDAWGFECSYKYP